MAPVKRQGLSYWSSAQILVRCADLHGGVHSVLVPRSAISHSHFICNKFHFHLFDPLTTETKLPILLSCYILLPYRYGGLSFGERNPLVNFNETGAKILMERLLTVANGNTDSGVNVTIPPVINDLDDILANLATKKNAKVCVVDFSRLWQTKTIIWFKVYSEWPRSLNGFRYRQTCGRDSYKITLENLFT